MEKFQNLSEQEMKTINGGGLISSISGIVSGAISRNWTGMTSSIIETVKNGIAVIGSRFTSGW